ncbi:MAG: LOG family protein [Deltaproteobacteria bacterium]|nr:MAG: LOG family protein [Deltaproteobacteria bacterium]
MTDDDHPLPDHTGDPNGDPTHQLVEGVLHDLWTIVNKLAKVRPTKPERYRVAVFGSARIKPGEPLYDEVKELTRTLSELGCDIVSGGGPGLMQAANEGSQLGDPEDQRASIGVTIALPFEKGANPFVEQLYTHESFYTRLHQFVRLSHAFVVFGGGVGTTLESLLVWQLLQVRHLENVPFIMVGDMWRELVGWSKKHMLTSTPPLANAADLELPACVDTPAQALELLRPHIASFQEAAPGGQAR